MLSRSSLVHFIGIGIDQHQVCTNASNNEINVVTDDSTQFLSSRTPG
jgi:hypothetical protein